MDPIRVGIVGCGKISPAYCRGLQQFPILEIIACSDIDKSRAEKLGNEYGIPKRLSPDQLFSDNEVDLIVNLTVPVLHHEITLAAIIAGKHVWSEKPLAVVRSDGQNLVRAAKEAKLLLGCAPDTFLGGGHQTCRKLIDDEWLGQPLHAVAFMTGHGHENWHPDPEFYYKRGGGPLFDMGPYYLTALVNLLGPVSRVTGTSHISFNERIIGSNPKFGERIKVEVPTHVQALLEFSSGVQAVMVMSFDVWAANLPKIEIYGTNASLSVPDPNQHGGVVKIGRAKDSWEVVPLTHGYIEPIRGIGVADMAYALQSGRVNRASSDLALHVLDIMSAIYEASDSNSYIDLVSSCEKPIALPTGLTQGELY